MFSLCRACSGAWPSASPSPATPLRCIWCAHTCTPDSESLVPAYTADLDELELTVVAADGGTYRIDALPADLGRDSEFRSLQSNRIVSRTHCRIGYDAAENSFYIEDLGSAAGTFVQDKRIGQGIRTPIRPGEGFQIANADVSLRVRLRTETPPTSASMPPVNAKSISLPAGDRTHYLFIGKSGEIESSSFAPDESLAAAALVASAGAHGTRLVVLNRAQVRLNGCIAIDRSLNSGDRVQIGSTLLEVNLSRGCLEPVGGDAAPSMQFNGVRVTVRNEGALRRILGDITCSIPPGRLTAIVGESGSGKSTLINVLAGRLEPDEGTVRIDHQPRDWPAFSDWARRTVSVVPQASVVHEELTVGECLRFQAALRYGIRAVPAFVEEKVTRVLATTRLVSLEHSRISRLSGGELKRVNVAAELIGAPAVVLLDEPQTGLDFVTERELITELRLLSRQGRTIIFVTHSLATLEHADHVIVIGKSATNGASVLAEGSPEQIKSRFKSDRWEEIAAQFVVPSGKRADNRRPAAPPVRTSFTPGLPRLVLLLLRYWRVWWSSPMASTLSLLGLPLLLGLLIRMAVSSDAATGEDRLLFGGIAAFWIGMNQSVREIVRERSIFLHEVGPRVGAASYLLSKVLFFAGVGVMQSLLLLIPIKWLSIEQFHFTLTANELARTPALIILLMLWLAITAGVAMGLFLSSLCMFIRHKGETVATLMVVLITLPQFLYSHKVISGTLVNASSQLQGFQRWHESNPLPELLSFFTFSRYLFLPMYAPGFAPAMAMRSLAFNGSVVLMAIAVLLILSWVVLETFLVRSRQRR